MRDSNITKVLSSLFSPDWIEEQARETGFIQRSRKIDPVSLFWTLVLGFGVGNARTFAALRRCYQSESGDTVVASSFYDRFTVRLADLMKRALAHLLDTAAEPSRAMKGRLSSFRDVVALDSTVLKLHEMLAHKYAGTRHNNKAAAKLNLAMSVVGRGPHTVKIASERVTEPQIMQLGQWVEGRLLIFDLGYYGYDAFRRINNYGGFFISKIKTNTNPTIIRSLCEAGSADIERKKLQAILPEFNGDTLDVEGLVSYRKKVGKQGATRETRCSFRFVVIRDANTGKKHVFITNVPREKLDVVDIANTYRIRWEIELIFRQLKSQFRLSDFPSRKSEAVEALIIASIITLAVSRTFLMELKKLSPHLAERMPFERWSVLFAEFSVLILHVMLKSRRRKRKRPRQNILELMFKEAIDPNAARKGGLVGKVETNVLTSTYKF